MSLNADEKKLLDDFLESNEHLAQIQQVAKEARKRKNDLQENLLHMMRDKKIVRLATRQGEVKRQITTRKIGLNKATIPTILSRVPDLNEAQRVAVAEAIENREAKEFDVLKLPTKKQKAAAASGGGAAIVEDDDDDDDDE